jgi:hypothetical protein
VRSAVIVAHRRQAERHNIGWRYFSSVAKAANVARDLARPIFQKASELYGFKWAYDNCYRMCPRCIAGRWGSITSTELYFNKSGPLLGRIIQAVLDPLKEKKKKAKAGPEEGVIVQSSLADDPQFEEQAEYRLRMGRWRREVYTIMEDNFVWWTVIDLNVCLHQPFTHHHNFMAQVQPVDKPQHVALMVFGKAHAILAEFEPLFRDASWALDLAVRIPQSDAKHLGSLLLLGVELGCNLSAGYWRRIVRPLEQCPLK